MNDEEKEKMLKELVNLTSLYSNISGGVNFDFDSLYPSTFTMNLASRKLKRMNKIKNIFSL